MVLSSSTVDNRNLIHQTTLEISSRTNFHLWCDIFSSIVPKFDIFLCIDLTFRSAKVQWSGGPQLLLWPPYVHQSWILRRVDWSHLAGGLAINLGVPTNHALGNPVWRARRASIASMEAFEHSMFAFRVGTRYLQLQLGRLDPRLAHGNDFNGSICRNHCFQECMCMQ